MDLNRRWNLVVVGGGILGLATAREWRLRNPSDAIAVVEREPRIAAHQTSHNSGVVHAGIYYKPGSLKARLCAQGREQLYAFCDQHGVPYEKVGKLIIALDRRELGGLDEIERRARANQVPGLRRVGPDEMRELEPHANGVAGLFSPETGVVDFAAVAAAIADQLSASGVTVATGIEVSGFAGADGRTVIRHAAGELEAERVVVCAGAWSDRVAMSAGGPPDPCIVPFRGAYLRLRPHRRSLVRGLIYPVPDPSLPFLGVHFTKLVDGDVLLGPTALMVGARTGYSLRTLNLADLRSTFGWPGTWRMMRRWWWTGARELRLAASRRAFIRSCARYVPDLGPDDVDDAPGPAGIRAQAVGRDGTLIDDFVVSRVGGAVHVRNAPSPAATSSLAIARMIVDGLISGS